MTTVDKAGALTPTAPRVEGPLLTALPDDVATALLETLELGDDMLLGRDDSEESMFLRAVDEGPQTTTLEALSRGRVLPRRASPEVPRLQRPPDDHTPLGGQGFQRLSPTYFEDIANVDETDEVPTWDVRPDDEVDDGPSPLRPVHLDRVEAALDDPAEASLWWVPAPKEARAPRREVAPEDPNQDTQEQDFVVVPTEEAVPWVDEEPLELVDVDVDEVATQSAAPAAPVAREVRTRHGDVLGLVVAGVAVALTVALSTALAVSFLVPPAP